MIRYREHVALLPSTFTNQLQVVQVQFQLQARLETIFRKTIRSSFLIQDKLFKP